MSLANGTKLGPYEIQSPLGAGGMGEVYRAKDTKLGRDVAIKVLPGEFFEDRDRVARFEREARALAALNHPNIAAIFSFEEIAGTPPRHLLAMELAEGEGLDARIARGAVSLDEAFAIARQIAEALEAAHEKGIVHRDLKPANVKVTEDGKVKLLDFGLAKALEGDPSRESFSSGQTESPTLTARATAAGMILGTAAYMSPEQARGKAADKRADVWAFGVVLFEMLAGRRLFEGETISDTLAAVLREPIDWKALPASTPPSVRSLLERCLERDPKQRLQAIGESRIALERTIAGSVVGVAASGLPGAARSVPPARFYPALAALFLAVAAVFGFLFWRESRREEREIRATINPPAGMAFVVDTTQPGPPALSPDGRKLVFSARGADGKVRLYVRPLEAAEAYALTGTDGAQYPFWSPDSRFIGFGADQKLKKIDSSGGPPITLCRATDFPKGGAWSPTGVIVFAPASAGPLEKVSENGGESTSLTKLDASRGENSHRLPVFLPDGRHFLFLARLTNANLSEGHAILVGSTEGGEPKLLLRSPAAAEYANGHLLYVRDRAVMAQPFDMKSLAFRGEARPVAENVSLISAGAAKAILSVSQTGLLVHGTGAAASAGARLEWVDRGGKVLGALPDLAAYDEVSFSPDGKSAALSVGDEKAGTHDLWIYDLVRNLRTRFTFDPGEEQSPRWSPDGRFVVFAAGRGPQEVGLYRKSVAGSGEEELLYTSPLIKRPNAVSPDGKLLVFHQLETETGLDLWVLPLSGDRKPYPFLKTKFNEAGAAFSPDGKWLAYQSNESGRTEIFVTPFPGPGRKWQVSVRGGTYPAWRAGGKEIVFQEGGTARMISVPVSLKGETPEFGAATELFFATPSIVGIASRIDSAPDAKRFLMIHPADTKESGALTLVVHWTAGLKGKK